MLLLREINGVGNLANGLHYLITCMNEVTLDLFYIAFIVGVYCHCWCTLSLSVYIVIVSINFHC